MTIADSNSDIVKNLMNALEANDKEVAANYLADTFIASGWTPQSVNKNAFLNIITEIKEGIPGLIFNLHNVQETNERTVTATMQIAGYQSDSFIIPELGTPPIPQTASSVNMPPEDVRYTLEHGLVTSMYVQPREGGGIRGLLRQLGIELIIAQ